MGLVERFALSAYDAAYLELAQRHRLPLASLDEERWLGFSVNSDGSGEVAIKMTAARRLAATLAADVAGYSQLMGRSRTKSEALRAAGCLRAV